MANKDDSIIFENKLLDFVCETDPILSMMNWMLDRMMELEVKQKTNSEKGKHSSERTSYRCGYRTRRFDTRLGTVYLAVPKLRNGGYIPFFVTEKKRSEQALMQVIQECWKNGVSTRKIENIAKSMGIENISHSQASEINKGLDSIVQEFRTRPLESEYPVIWVDALYEKIRNVNRVESMAVMVVKAIDMQGRAQILAVEPMINESKETYSTLFRNLKNRGLEKVWLCVSDAHKGLQAAIGECFIGTSWQRCKVHFMRNILAFIPQKEKESFAAKLKLIWKAPDKYTAQKIAKQIIDDFGSTFPKAIDCLEDGLEDSLQFYEFKEIDSRKISSTNTLERLNREVRRRTQVVGIFPSIDSYIRLVSAYLIEYSEDCSTDRCYINSTSLALQREILYEAS